MMVLVMFTCMCVGCLSAITRVFARFFLFYVSRLCYQLCVSLLVLLFSRDFVGSVTSRGEKSCVRRVERSHKDLLWLVITGCICTPSPPTCYMLYTAQRGETLKVLPAHTLTHTLVYHSPPRPFFLPRLPTSHLATACVTATVKQTPIIPERCDSNPPVSPLKALETQVLQWHVSACQTQSKTTSMEKVATFLSPWDVVRRLQGNVFVWVLFAVCFCHVFSCLASLKTSLQMINSKSCGCNIKWKDCLGFLKKILPSKYD